MASLKNATILARHFTTGNAAQQLVKPRIALFGMEGRYANALYSAASKQKKLEAVEKDLLKFQAAIKKDKELSEFLSNPLVSKTLKQKAIQGGLKKLNYNELTVNFFGALAENGRMKYTNAIVDAYSKIMSAERGEICCEVVTAKALDEATEKELQTALGAFAKKGEKILLTKKVDPSILGGMLVSIEDKFIDMSTAAKVKQYSAVIKQAL